MNRSAHDSTDDGLHPCNPRRYVLAAWIVGGCIYMLFAMEVIGDAGFIAFPFQLIMGAVFSLVVVGVAALVGFLLNIPTLGRVWYSSSIPSIALQVSAGFLILFGRELGVSTTISNPDSITTYKTLHPAVAYGSMFAAVFATLHFSRGRVSW
jgi:hypothetical protein